MVLSTEFGRTPRINGNDGRDHHDEAVACLVANLHPKGLLDQTLVVLGAGFGRTPRIKDNDGREHCSAFSACWPGLGVRSRTPTATTSRARHVRRPS